jgi:hypothetical protein
MKYRYFLFLVIFYNTGLQAQVSNDSILKDFNNFLKIQESNVYLHLNKSVLMQGEDLGFAAYVLDHKKQKPSLLVKNLYSQLLNSDSEVVKEQLLLVEQGKAQGVFELDSLVTPGTYTVRAFTNWMKNYSSPHYFEAPIQIISPLGKLTNSKIISSPIAHVLPEGGHLVNNVLTTVGLKIENDQPLNNKFANFIIDGVVESKVQLDANGMGRFAILPNLYSSYEISLEGSNEVLKTEFPKIEDHGVVMAVNQVADEVFIELRTNERTLDHLDSEKMSVLVNSNGKLDVYYVELDYTKEVFSLNIQDFSPGVNQITLLSQDQKVISKRLFFNYEGFTVSNMDKVVSTRALDTLKTSLQFSTIKNAQLSVSVHTTSSIAMDRSQSIVAAFKLDPYLYGKVKNPLYYLTNVDKRVKYDMDNLMLCLGWELYDWSFIFQKSKLFKYGFEFGIAVNATINKSKARRYIIYPSRNSGTSFVNLKKGDEKFSFGSYFPTIKEKLKISEVDTKGRTKKAKLSLQFSPNKIPNFTSLNKIKPLEISIEVSEIELKPFSDFSEELDTIVLIAEKNKKRELKIRNRAKGRIDFFSDKDRKNEVRILQYLGRNGLKVSNRRGQMSVISQRLLIAGAIDPVLIVLDGVPYRDANVLQGFNMSDVDYIEIDETGTTQVAGQGRGGIVTIKTDPLLNPFGKSSTSLSSFDVPLTFSAPVKFFKPTYYSYTDDFFDKLGVIDWQSDITVVDGKASFTMPYVGKDKLLFHIQGWTEDGELIDEYREVEVE